MTEQNLKNGLKQALDHAAPNDLEEVLSRCETRKGNVIPMTTKSNRSHKWLRPLAAACLALVLAGGAGGYVYQQTGAVAAVVSLDVNPSIELKVNRKERVVAAAALNQEAQVILQDMDLKDTDLTVAVNAIVGALLQNGYLDSISSAILISVEDRDQDRAARLQQSLTGTVDQVLQNAASGAGVLSQVLQQDTALEQQAHQSNISVGKGALISRIQAKNEALKFEELAALSVDELDDLLDSQSPALPIGKAAAIQAVADKLGITDLKSVRWDVDAELDELQPHYEVEIEGREERGYRVDAYTGEVLDGQGAQEVPSKPADPAAPAQSITLEQAKAIALAHAGLSGDQVSFRETKQDRENGVPAYEIEFKANGREYEYDIAVADGSILHWDNEWDDDGKAPAGNDNPAGTQTPQTGDIGAEQAKSRALSHAGLSASQVSALRVERDYDDGRLEYEVEFRSGGLEYEYTIDAATGAVLEHEVDRDD